MASHRIGLVLSTDLFFFFHYQQVVAEPQLFPVTMAIVLLIICKYFMTFSCRRFLVIIATIFFPCYGCYSSAGHYSTFPKFVVPLSVVGVTDRCLSSHTRICRGCYYPLTVYLPLLAPCKSFFTFACGINVSYKCHVLIVTYGSLSYGIICMQIEWVLSLDADDVHQDIICFSYYIGFNSD